MFLPYLRWQRTNPSFPVFYGACSWLSFWTCFQSFRVRASYENLRWYLFKPISLCSLCPFAKLISIIWHPDVLFCCSSRGGALLFWRLRGRGGHCWSTLCFFTSSVLQLCVGASRLAGVWGVKSLLVRERWRWWWRRRRVEVFIYHRPSLLFHGTRSSFWEFASFRTKLGHLGSHTILTVYPHSLW